MHIKIITQTKSEDASRMPPRILLSSTGTEIPLEAKTGHSHFSRIVEEILACWIKCNLVVQSILRHAKHVGASKHPPEPSMTWSCPLLAIETSLPGCKAATNEIISWIKDPVGFQVRSTGSGQSKLTVVGMAGRLPGTPQTLRSSRICLRKN
ncbi:hypothetical protein GCG54_00011665 [Colletotrichum gloeosporioides]|uniref:Uncharacterized protein n=1 Tax=Colletotrichum gloeosporioides TaxID=474922 RepID=A0A8H4FJ73_COLGL|nr:uncharacterized protein GCG54_00011665 [Colletotrichum gloeosporioides]KAF3803826.1 hypothetical protein GCG54_00011665 [Colletotrichum gloeosporioides]